MSADELDKSFLQRMIYLSAIVVFGLLVWLVFTNILSPKKSTGNDVYTQNLPLVSRAISPELSVQAISKMSRGRTFSVDELAGFSIYLINETETRSSGVNVLALQEMTPRVPYDIGYVFAMSRNVNYLADTNDDQAQAVTVNDDFDDWAYDDEQ